MNCFLKYKDKKILQFELGASTVGHVVFSATILEPTLLPEMLKNISEEELPGQIMQWLSQRAIPDNRFDIDEMLIKLYGFRYCDCGRMYYHQHVAALLSHYASWFDNYTIDVDDPYPLYFGYEDFRFITLWFLAPYNYNPLSKHSPKTDIDVFLENTKTPAPTDFNTYALTIPSTLPSWWHKENDKIYLCQRLVWSNHKAQAKIMLDIFNKYIPEFEIIIEDDIVKIDYSDYIGMDCSWLIEFFDKEYYSGEKSWDEYIIYKKPEAENVAKIFKQIYLESKEKNIPFDFYNYGIGVLNNKYFPVVMF